jgi:hypothetical protein
VTPFAVERTNKTDQMVGTFNLGGELPPAISVEIAGRSDAVITVRDRDGRMLYRLDPGERMTIVTKRMMQPPAAPRSRRPVSSGATNELPDGCESAFSPYVEPGMANVIGRCVSELTGNVQIASR